MTLIYELDPYALKVYQMSENQLTLYAKAFKSYHQTDMTETEIIIMAALGGNNVDYTTVC